MKRTIMGWFILANLFCFVTTFADLKLPWLPEAEGMEQQKRITDAGILTQSALGGAAGSYLGLLLTKRLSLPGQEYFQTSLYLLMGQNAMAYLIALILAWRLRNRQSVRTSYEKPERDRTGSFGEASA